MGESLHTLSDAALLERCRREPEAFVLVYDRHARGLLVWVGTLCGDREVALEIVQETFARALKEAPRFRAEGDGSALPWLRTVARNLVHDWRRKGVVQDRVRRELAIVQGVDEPAVRVEERLDAAEAGARVQDALHRLPADQREAVEARVVRGEGYDEIARTAGVSRETARARVSRGLRALRSFLSATQPGRVQ
jgi:RNA polymerase sigma factor (sigma-70 family)